MATQVLMPQLGEAVEEATITRWLKSEGDVVEEFEALVEVNTDKVDTEIPSPTSGTLLKIAQPKEGATVGVGVILAWIGQPGELIPSQDSSCDNELLETENIHTTVSTSSKDDPISDSRLEQGYDSGPKQSLGFISPVVAKIAIEHDVNLQKVQGTGLKGRITKRDILKYVDSKQFLDTQRKTITPATETEILEIDKTEKIILHSPIRRRIAEHMVLSKHTSPHVTTVFEADMSKIVAHRTLNKDRYARNGAKLTFTAYFVAATSKALSAFPMVNSSWMADGLLLHSQINIGMATSLGEDGLIVPIINNANHLSLLGIARSINDLANRARNKKLLPDEVAGGTFTITNHGVSGSLFAIPIINQPQCAILGVGKLQKRVIVLEDITGYDTISIRPMVYLTLTFDHRILDGAIADYFLSKVVEILENWT